MRANLHLHSRFSDGTIWPEEVAERAAAAGLELAALTDHDTLAGTAEFAAACARRGLRAVAGVEIDCREPSIGYKSELLVYFPKRAYAWTAAFLDEIKQERLRSIRRAVELAGDHFANARLNFSALAARKKADRIEASSDEFSYSKVDVYLYLRDEGAIPGDMDYKAFKKAYFDTRVLTNGGREKPLCSEVAALAAKDGGTLVVPHIGHEFADDPGLMKKEKERLTGMLEYFKSIGAAAVELYHYRNAAGAELNKLVKKAAKPLGYFFTYGSDCHGPGSGKDTIGEFDGRFKGFPKS